MTAAEILQMWRRAIREHDTDAVLTCDQIFADSPNLYTPVLIESAQHDEDDRVRAFSTRMLGKFKSPDVGPLFVRLLEDPNPAVRGNAAWGLGYLSPQVGQAALERVRDRDRDPSVKQRAAEALTQLRGDVEPRAATRAHRGK